MRVLITGITGFVGSHMAEYALSKGAEVFGSTRWRSKTENIDHLRSKVSFIESDLRDLSSVRALLETSQPDYVIHLAAQSFVGVSWHAPAETLTTNILAQINVLEAIRGLKMSPRFLAVGSSEEYGLVHDEELPIRETNPRTARAAAVDWSPGWAAPRRGRARAPRARSTGSSTTRSCPSGRPIHCGRSRRTR